MQHRKFIHRLTPWLTLYLLVVSVGLPLQRVYCACLGEAEVTLAGVDHECAGHTPEPVATDHHRMACCKVTTDCQLTASADHDCGTSELLVAALDADFLLESPADLSVIDMIALPVSWADYKPHPAREVAKQRPIRGPAPPATLAGRQLLIAHQTFLI